MKIKLYQFLTHFLFALALILYAKNMEAQDLKSTFNNPLSCGFKDGNITIAGLTANTSYQVSYKKNNVPVNPVNILSDASGKVTIPELSAGTYTEITLNNGNNSPALHGSIELNDSCVAQQSVKFLAAAFTNFTGVQDDDPGNYNQVYARLSQPFKKYSGIASNAKDKDRTIWLRNGLFELTYGSTDNFKLYSIDTLNDKYANKLDLLAHAYFNATASFNVLTYILPADSKGGDIAHLYLDLMASLALTNVTDSILSNNKSSSKTYNVKSNLYGFHCKAKFQNAEDSRFIIEAGFKLFWITCNSGSLNAQLNPQSINIPDLEDSHNMIKNFARTKNKPYLGFDALIQYNTSSKSDNASNIFIHYAYTSNYARASGPNFRNDYFQFQLGYAQDISKIFKKPS